MKFKKYLRDKFLTEGPSDDVYERTYKKMLSKEEFDRIIGLDPTNKEKNGVVFTGSFLQWLLSKIYKADPDSLTKEVGGLLSRFNKLKNKPNIMSFDSVDALKTFINEVDTEKDDDVEKKLGNLFKKATVPGGYDIFTFNNYEASNTLFGNTGAGAGLLVKSNWCTAYSKSYYDSYTGRGNIYVIRDRNKNPPEYWQVHISHAQNERGNDYQFQWQDEHDRKHSGTDFVDWIKEKHGLKEYFKSKLKASESVSVGGSKFYYSVNEAGIREFGDINIEDNKQLKAIPVELGDGKLYVCKSFDISNCTGITSLEYSPQKVSGTYKCINTKIVNLEGAPESVGSFDCSDNPELVSLKGSPVSGGDFRCSGCPKLESMGGISEVSGDIIVTRSGIKSFKGLENFGGDNISAENCTDLSDLTGLPPHSLKSLTIDHCAAKTLKGCPKKIRSKFSLRWLPNLESFKGGPKIVDGDFNAAHCEAVETCEGLPTLVGKSLTLSFCTNLSSLKGITPRNKVGDAVGLSKTSIPEDEIRNYLNPGKAES